jgi:hypothetical protein
MFPLALHFQPFSIYISLLYKTTDKIIFSMYINAFLESGRTGNFFGLKMPKIYVSPRLLV